MAHPEHIVSIGPQGRIVVPARFRRELGLAEGATLAITSDGRRLILEPRDEVLRRARARYARARSGGRRLSDELIAERREEARRESAR